MTHIRRINAVFIYVKDMEKMRHFYEHTLGLGKPVLETDMWVEYKLDGSDLALHQGDPNVVVHLSGRDNTVKFSMEVDDIEIFYQELVGKGVTFTIVPRRDFHSLLAE